MKDILFMNWPLFAVILLSIFFMPHFLRMGFLLLEKEPGFGTAQAKAEHAKAVRRVADLRLLLCAAFFAFLSVMCILRLNFSVKSPASSEIPTLEAVVITQD